MWKFFSKAPKKKSQEDYLAPETKPVIGNGRIFVISKDEKEVAPEKISYKLIKKRRRDQSHNLY